MRALGRIVFSPLSLKAPGGRISTQREFWDNACKFNELSAASNTLKRQCARAGVLSEYRKREHYEKPSIKKKKKSEAAKRKKKKF